MDKVSKPVPEFLPKTATRSLTVAVGTVLCPFDCLPVEPRKSSDNNASPH